MESARNIQVEIADLGSNEGIELNTALDYIKCRRRRRKKSNVNNSSLLSRQMSVAKQFEFKVGAGKRWS